MAQVWARKEVRPPYAGLVLRELVLASVQVPGRLGTPQPPLA